MPLDLTSIRKHLHANPELSGHESQTAKYLKKKITDLGPDRIISNIGFHSFAVVFHQGKDRTILFRADMDGLPIKD